MLTISNLNFSYNGGPAVLKGIDLKVEEGQFVGILGPNGSGKSTLLRCITRSERVEGGSVFLRGKDINDIGRREMARMVAVVPQEELHEFQFTALEVASMGRYPHLGRFEFESPVHGRIVERAMRSTGTWDLRDKRITSLSGGEKQRVVIARALAQEPSLLLLDEPTKNLDISHTLEILSFMERMNSKGKLTVVAVFHDLNLAARYCSRAVLIKEGRVRYDGAIDQVLNRGAILDVFGVDVRIRRGDPLRIDIL